MNAAERGDDDNLRALESLRRASDQARPGRSPGRASPGKKLEQRDWPSLPSQPSDEPPLRLAPASEPSPAEREFLRTGTGNEADTPATAGPRCLGCGYPLMSWRCSECGLQNDPATVNRWFHGEEKTRLDRIIWSVVAVLLLQLWTPLPLYWVTRILAAVASGVACYSAAMGRRDTMPGFAAAAGVVASVVLALLSFGGRFSLPYYAVHMACGGLLLISAVSDPRVRVLGWRVSRLAGLAVLVVAPLLAYGLGELYRSEPNPTHTLEIWLLGVTPFCFAAATWGFAGAWIFRTRQRLFGAAEDSGVYEG